MPTLVKLFRESNIRVLVSSYWELTKPGITFMVILSMMIGFFMGSLLDTFNIQVFIHAIIGTFLTAGGTSAYNQYIERNLDKLMLRTSKRPLPMHKVGAKNAQIFALLMIFTGLSYLILTVNPIAASVSAATTIIYLFAYTPLKRVSFINVIIGSIPGALPPVGGWASATGSLDQIGMWYLFTIVFLWQLPHVIAIAWLCNDDYTKAGFVMLPKFDKTGLYSSTLSLFSTLTLIALSVIMFFDGFTGTLFLVGSILAALYFAAYAILHLKNRTRESARKLMFASLFYLPIVWILIVVDKLI